MPLGSFRVFHKDERQAWQQFLKLLRTLDTSSTSPDDSVILIAVKHDRELWQLLPSKPFQHLKIIKLTAPLEILRERLAVRLKPYENLQILSERILVPGQEWVACLESDLVFDTSTSDPEELVQCVLRNLISRS